MRTLYPKLCRFWGPTVHQQMDPDEEMSCDESGHQHPTWKSRGGEAGITLGTGIDVAVYIAMSVVLDVVSRETVTDGGRGSTT